MFNENDIANCPECKGESHSRKKVTYRNKVTGEQFSGYETFCKPKCKAIYENRYKGEPNNWEEISSK